MQIHTNASATPLVAIIEPEGETIDTEQDALDLIGSVSYYAQADRMVVPKDMFPERFYDLSTRFAGDVLQKYVNYGMKLAIVGDFSGYTSTSLKDFIRESNRGSQLFFVDTQDEALERLRAAR